MLDLREAGDFAEVLAFARVAERGEGEEGGAGWGGAGCGEGAGGTRDGGGFHASQRYCASLDEASSHDCRV